MDNIAQLQEGDPHPLYRAMEEQRGSPPYWNRNLSESQTTKIYSTQWPLLEMKDYVMYRKWLDQHRQTKWLQLLVRDSLVEQVLTKAHIGATGGHSGIKQTLSQVQRRAYWPGWRKDTVNYCNDASIALHIIVERYSIKQNFQICWLAHLWNVQALTWQVRILKRTEKHIYLPSSTISRSGQKLCHCQTRKPKRGESSSESRSRVHAHWMCFSLGQRSRQRVW